MSDIPKMLRAEALIADEDWTGIYQISPDLAFAAADRIEKLEAALQKLAVITDCDIEGKHPIDTKLTWARQKLFDARQIASKALDAK